MALYVNKVIEVAKSQIGYKETGDNLNKYAKELDSIKYYNTQKYPAHADWCAIFTDWCIYTALEKNKSQALKANYEPSKDNCGASCYYQYVYFNAKKRYFKNNPKKGDKVIFGTALKHGSVTHIGLVIDVNGDKITTVEGNKSNQVKKCSYTLGAKGSRILGFLRPEYAEEPEPTPTPTPTPPEPTPTPTPSKKVVKATQSAKSYSKSYAKKYTVSAKSSLNMRNGAGTKYSVMTTIPYGAQVTCYGYYTEDWLYVRYETKTVIYEGFCNKAYLK